MNELCQLCSGMLLEYCRTVMFRRDVKILRCEKCRSQKVSNPDWLEITYQQGWANSDTGRVSRAIHSAGDIIFTLFFLKQDTEIGRMLDYGGGEGLLTRILRDHGFDAYNYDPYSISNLSFGFNLESILDNDSFSVISIIEVLEHLTNPRDALGDLLKKLRRSF